MRATRVPGTHEKLGNTPRRHQHHLKPDISRIAVPLEPNLQSLTSGNPSASDCTDTNLEQLGDLLLRPTVIKDQPNHFAFFHRQIVHQCMKAHPQGEIFHTIIRLRDIQLVAAMIIRNDVVPSVQG